MTPVNGWLVVYPPGARGDFLAGWLGTLPNFIDTKWRIDAETGASFGDMNITKAMDHDPLMSVSTCFADYQLYLDSLSSINIATVSHGNGLHSRITVLGHHAPTPIIIHVDQSFIHKIVWEFVVKTFMTKNRSNDTISQWVVGSKIDDMTDSARCRYTDQQLRTYTTKSIDVGNWKTPYVILEYSKINTSSGSRYVAEMLGIEVSDRHHGLWEQMLPLAEAPNEIYRFGKWWRFSDYFGVE